MSKPLPPRPALPAPPIVRPEPVTDMALLPEATSPLTPEADPARVEALIKQVKLHLDRFAQASKEPASSLVINTPSDPSKGVLEIPGVTGGVGYLCILQAFSNASTMIFRVDPNRCSLAQQASIRKAISDAAEKAVMDTSDKGYTSSTKLFSSLYQAIISMMKIIGTRGSYQPTPGVNSSLSRNFQELIRQVISYLRRYMDVYRVTDQKMINKSYDLLYLMTIMGMMRAESTGFSVSDLEELYQKVNTTIELITESYKQLIVPGSSLEEQKSNPEIDDLMRRLSEFYQSLERQRREMEGEISSINNSQTKLRKTVPNGLVALGKAVEAATAPAPATRGRPALPAPPVRGGQAGLQKYMIDSIQELNQLIDGVRDEMLTKTRIYSELNQSLAQFL